MHTSSSLPQLSLSLSEVSVSDSSPSLPAKQSSSDSVLSCNVYFAASAENCCGRDTCGGDDGGGGGGGGVFLLHTRFCVIGDFRFAGFISSSGNCCPLNHKGTSTRVNLRKPAVYAMLVLIKLKVSFS